MKRRIRALFIACIILVSSCLPVFAVESDSAGNLFESAETVSISDMPFFGAIAIGKDIGIDRVEAKGSVAAAGRTVGFDSSNIGESLYVAGETVSLKGTNITGNLFAAGSTVSVTGQKACNGAYLAGKEVTFEGTAKGLYAAGSKVSLTGTIEGDVSISADTIEIAPDAVVTGQLEISSSQEPAIPETAQIGSYSFKKTEKENESEQAERKNNTIQKKILKGLFWIVAMAAIGMLMCWLFDAHLTRAGEYLKNRTGAFIGAGIGGFFLIPLAAIFLCITLILAPVGGILLLMYFLFLFVATAFAGASLGRIILPNRNVFLSALICISYSSISWTAPAGQATSQAGRRPWSIRAAHREHFRIFPWSVIWGIPQGQAVLQRPQPIQEDSSTRTIPSSL